MRRRLRAEKKLEIERGMLSGDSAARDERYRMAVCREEPAADGRPWVVYFVNTTTVAIESLALETGGFATVDGEVTTTSTSRKDLGPVPPSSAVEVERAGDDDFEFVVWYGLWLKTAAGVEYVQFDFPKYLDGPREREPILGRVGLVRHRRFSPFWSRVHRGRSYLEIARAIARKLGRLKSEFPELSAYDADRKAAELNDVTLEMSLWYRKGDFTLLMIFRPAEAGAGTAGIGELYVGLNIVPDRPDVWDRVRHILIEEGWGSGAPGEKRRPPGRRRHGA